MNRFFHRISQPAAFRKRITRSAMLLFCCSAFAAQAQVAGGTVTDDAGNDVVWTCPGDGMADFINLANTSTSSAPYQYLVTDANDTVLALPPAAMVELEGAGTGNCKVYGLSYTGSLTVAPGDHIPSVAAFSDGMWDLSDNFLLTVRDQPDTAMLALEDGSTSVTICAGDGSPDPLRGHQHQHVASAFPPADHR